MRWIALHFDGAAVVNRNQHPAGVGTVMRTGGMNNMLHG
jgi:ribonuclease HI